MIIRIMSNMKRDKKNVFVIGLDEFNLSMLNHLPEADYCRFLPAVKFEEMRGVDQISIDDLIKTADKRIDQAGTIDAVITYFDFPASLMMPVIAKKYNLHGPSIESVLKCEHKYWGRLEQKKVVPGAIPSFKAFDPNDKKAWQKIDFKPPFWIKPVKSYHSYLAYQITDEDSFRKAIAEVKENIGYFTEPFCELLKKYNVPDKLSPMNKTMFAETQIGGLQGTVEGYVYDDEVIIYGIVDTIKEKDCPSLARYKYPSTFPYEVQYRMAELSRRVIEQIGLNYCAFNIEYFYDEETNDIYLLEVNPRMSQSHAYMFEKVHGISHHHVITNLALGKRPKPLKYEGEYRLAGHFMLRAFEPGVVKKAPDRQKTDALEKHFPGLIARVNVNEGMHLNDMDEHHTDSYSYVLADIYLGADNEKELLEKYHAVVEELSIEINNQV